MTRPLPRRALLRRYTDDSFVKDIIVKILLPVNLFVRITAASFFHFRAIQKIAFYRDAGSDTAQQAGAGADDLF